MVFGISLNGSRSKTSTSSNSTSSSTTTRLAPEWATAVAQGAAGRVGDLMGQDPYGLVAPAHALQNQAAEGAAGLNDWSSGYGEAADLMRGAAAGGASPYDSQGYRASAYGGAQVGPTTQAEAGSLLKNLNAYMSPYRREVKDAALADYDFGAGQTRAQQDLDLAGSGAFGGSGAALTRSMTEDGLVRGRATTSANLLDQMFNRGAALSNLDADRRTQVSMGNASAANAAALSQAQLTQQAGLARAEASNSAGQFNAAARNSAAQFNAGQAAGALNRQLEAGRGLAEVYGAQGAAQRANIATQAGLGETFRGIDQNQRQAPMTQAQQIVAMVSGLPMSMFTGEQTTGAQSNRGTSKTTSVSASASGNIGKGG